ncbi:uncharacterized protein E0L32_006000 [Thyridium curvatum]|uniref:Bromodomain-containing protein n=1 Tax=Thyridium curvatum TaxID=1093900 RepID=A0A507B7Z6_9PEZI|nr:uncharacterized protein E0L32_006000 [Thyridium curvatum]TPX13529.1 hypothetical protein E0L32_006000 [Thyridium curvatum]
MTTAQQPDGGLVDQKQQPVALKMASPDQSLPAAAQPTNGINGHTSPKVAPATTSAVEDNTLSKLDASKEETEAPTEAPKSPEKTDVQAEETQKQPAADEPSPKPAESTETTAVEAAVPAPEAPKDDPPPVESLAPAAPKDASPAPSPSLSPPKEPEAPAAVASEPKASPDLPPTEEPSEEKSAPEPKPAEDVDMIDAPQPEAPAPMEQNEDVQPTQATEASEAPALSSVGEPSQDPTVISNAALENSQEDVSAPATADTSMTDAPSQPAPKVAREREEDDVEEPVAKRARTEEAASQPEESSISAQPLLHSADEPAALDNIEVEKPHVARPTRVPGEPGSMGDFSQDEKPISQFANREIRKVLANVKKTKAGAIFKDPVKTKWPHLWDAYIAKVDRPVDISHLEHGLRQNTYERFGQFVEEVFLLYENSLQFNGPQHDVTGHAKSLVENIFTRMAEVPAEQPAKPERNNAKAQGARTHEPRAAAQGRRESRGAAVSPSDQVVESPVYAIPPSGMPMIRRDSAKVDDDRPKRPIHPPKSKDLGYEPKNLKKKKSSLDHRFCDEVLKELLKGKNWDANQFFERPVDPVQDGAPDYFKFIKKPMDLRTMQEKLQSGEYDSFKEFDADFKLIIKNCIKFNGPLDNGHLVTSAAAKLQDLYNAKVAEKDQWMAAHAPLPTAASPGADAKDSDEEEEASEPEEEEAAPVSNATIEALAQRLKEERDRLSSLIDAPLPNMALIKTQETVVSMITTQIVEEKTKLAQQGGPRKKASKPKAAKAKKAGGAGAAAGGGKKAAGGAGAAKKSGGGAKKAPKGRAVMGQPEKDAITNGINLLEGSNLEKAIEIIKKDTHQEESEDGELELDIDQLSQDALRQLYELVVKHMPHLKVKEVKKAPAASAAGLEGAGKGAGHKPKKHKPMGKAEQESRIQKLQEIKAQFQRPGSGSQEPLPSVEGNQAAQAYDSDDESEADSEEE